VGKWTRRVFITAGGLAGGGLALGVAGITFAPNRLGLVPEDAGEASWLTVWLKLTASNLATVVIPHCEMGQGTHTALAMMLAEELDADWGLVRSEEAPAEDAFANAHLLRGFLPFDIPQPLNRGFDYATFKVAEWVGLQVTGGSSSVRGTGRYGMQVAGAAARALLIEAAARRWNVPPAECTARLSRVSHAASGQSAGYGELAAEAAQLSLPSHPALKPREAYTLIGTSIPRLDIPGKAIGTTRYAVDVALPGMLYAAVRAAPVFGGTLDSVDSTAVEAMPGVKAIVRLDDAVAVVADGYWRAQKGVRALEPEFGDGGNGATTSAGIFDAQLAALGGDDLRSDAREGDGAQALDTAARVIEAQYRVPFLAHATMEPMSATARFADGRCEVWSGVQDPLSARKVAAEAAGLTPAQVTFHNQLLGGGFGRRLPGALDFIAQAVHIARAVAPAPVKLIWSREEDLQHDYYRAAVVAELKGGLDADGRLVAWAARYGGPADRSAGRPPYAVPHLALDSSKHGSHVPLGSWRSVNHSQHGFFVESFMDELAHAAGQDPLEFRRQALTDSPRHLAVLDRAAELAGWGTPLPDGRGRGIALVESFGSIVAEVADVEVTADGRIKVHQVCAAVDCGLAIHPDSAAAQIEGSIVFGLSAALFGEITIANGRVVQSNFHDYPVLKLADTPDIQVEFIRSGAKLGGLGEPGVPPVAPAVANAVFAATGRRLRQLPLSATPN
jgi:isoquinoline 1-oxidoreductase beta subunit